MSGFHSNAKNQLQARALAMAMVIDCDTVFSKLGALPE
jgi:hypothetical protein